MFYPINQLILSKFHAAGSGKWFGKLIYSFNLCSTGQFDNKKWKKKQKQELNSECRPVINLKIQR